MLRVNSLTFLLNLFLLLFLKEQMYWGFSEKELRVYHHEKNLYMFGTAENEFNAVRNPSTQNVLGRFISIIK